MLEHCRVHETGMMAVHMSYEALNTLIEDSGFKDVEIACYNGPMDYAVSGTAPPETNGTN
jgi:malonyl CoA-acyl carrier protein transacylase